MTNTNQVTLLIWSINRHQCLKKQLLSYSDWPLNLIFVDGSDEKWDLGDEGVNGKLSWEYLHRPGKSIKDRWIEGVQRVTTPFIIFGDDTDFVVLDSVFDGVTELKLSNSSTFYRCAELHLRTIYSKRRKINSRIVIPKVCRKAFTIENWNPIDKFDRYSKLWQVFRDNQQGLYFYSLHSTELSQNYSKIMQTIDFDCIALQFYEFYWVVFLILNAEEVKSNKIGRIKLQGANSSTVERYRALPVKESDISALTEWVRSGLKFENEIIRQEVCRNLFEALVDSQIHLKYPKFKKNKSTFLRQVLKTDKRVFDSIIKQYPSIIFLLDT